MENDKHYARQKNCNQVNKITVLCLFNSIKYRLKVFNLTISTKVVLIYLSTKTKSPKLIC